MTNIPVPAGLYDAMMTIQKHCEKQENCDTCCFNMLQINEWLAPCLFLQVPEDYADYNEFQRKEAKR